MDHHQPTKPSAWLDLIIFVLFANVFFFHSVGIVALGCFLTGLWVLLVKTFAIHKNLEKIVLLETGAMALTIGLLFMVDSPEKIAVLVLFAGGLFLVSVYSWLKQKEIEGLLELGLSSLLVAKEYLYSALLVLQGATDGTLAKAFQTSEVKKPQSPWIKSIIVGLLVGLPLIAWLVMTLTKADPVFASFVQNLFKGYSLEKLPLRVFFSALVFIVLVPLLIMKWRGYSSPLAWVNKVNWSREITVITGMIALVLGVFLAVQWPYVFVKVAHETDLAKFGVATYSEYVQKGFWDLLKVVLMVFAVSWVGVLLNRHQTGREKTLLMTIQGIFGLEFAVFVISIFRRVWLYQTYHGLSLARLYGVAGLVLVAGLTVTMALRYLSKYVQWVRVEMAWILIMVVAVIGLNMEALVVQYPPTVNNRVDYVYLARLPGDGYEGWIKSYSWAQGVLNKHSQQTGLLGKDDRREIYYAGAVARQLSKNYHELIMQYGTESELNEYFRQVITAKKDILASASAADLISADGTTKQARSQVIDGLSQSLNDLDHADWLEKVNITPAYSLQELAQLSQQDRDLTYYEVIRSKEYERLSGLDAFLASSPVQKQTYRRMRKEIGVPNLLIMQKQATALQQRIGLQPEKERGVDVDISLDSPFLD